jgi:hypothetical protein
MGGYECGRGYHPVNIAKEWSNDDNQYGDPIGWTVIGVESNGVIVSTRLHEWKIELAIKQEAVSAEDRSAGAPRPTGRTHRRAERKAPWSTVNNCTEKFTGALGGVPPI